MKGFDQDGCNKKGFDTQAFDRIGIYTDGLNRMLELIDREISKSN